MASETIKDICAICGDKAKGYNYAMPSCESCKLYYTRHGKTNYKEYNCNICGKSRIDALTKKYCERCRLKMRSTNEMKHLYADNQVEIYKYDEAIKTIKRELNQDNDDLDMVISIIEGDKINKQSNVEGCMQITSYSFNTEIKTEPDDSNKASYINQCSIVPILQQLDYYKYNLNAFEVNKLSELMSSLHILNPNHRNQPDPPITGLYSGLRKSLIKLEENARKLVMISKTLTPFEEICQDDQYYIIKNHTHDVHYLCKLRDYNYTMTYLGGFQLMGKSTTESIKRNIHINEDASKKFRYLHNSYYKSLIPEVGSDTIILDLLTAIAIFNPDTPCLVHPPIIKYQQYIYTHLLKRYLQIQYQSEGDSEKKFSKLMNTIEDLNKLRMYGRYVVTSNMSEFKKYIPSLVMELLI